MPITKPRPPRSPFLLFTLNDYRRRDFYYRAVTSGTQGHEREYTLSLEFHAFATPSRSNRKILYRASRVTTFFQDWMNFSTFLFAKSTPYLFALDLLDIYESRILFFPSIALFFVVNWINWTFLVLNWKCSLLL